MRNNFRFCFSLVAVLRVQPSVERDQKTKNTCNGSGSECGSCKFPVKWSSINTCDNVDIVFLVIIINLAMGSKKLQQKVVSKQQKGKGKRWKKGQSSSSNPQIKTYREAAKNRFFQTSTGARLVRFLKHLCICNRVFGSVGITNACVQF